MVWNCGRSSPCPSGHLNRLFFPLMQSINTYDSDDYLILSLVFLLPLLYLLLCLSLTRIAHLSEEGRMGVRSHVSSLSLFIYLSFPHKRRITPLFNSALFSSFDSMPKHPLIRSVPYTYFDWTDTFQYCTGTLDLLNTHLIGFTWILWKCLYVDCNLTRLSAESVISAGKSVKKKRGELCLLEQ